MDNNMLVTEVDPYYFCDEFGESVNMPDKTNWKDLLITWPKTRPLESYLEELDRARRLGHAINFRVSKLPAKESYLDWIGRPHRCYVVYNGWVRGYNNIIGLDHLGDNVVFDPISGEPYPEGNYIIRDPLWHPVEKKKKYGFQGWRYYSYE